jgi:hypothetical protein
VVAEGSVLGVEQHDDDLFALELGEVVTERPDHGSRVLERAARSRIACAPPLAHDAKLVHGSLLAVGLWGVSGRESDGANVGAESAPAEPIKVGGCRCEEGSAIGGVSGAELMPKRPLRLKIRIPEYVHPRNDWRRALHKAVREQQRRSPVRYAPDDRLELSIRLYLNPRALALHDVDNRLKDILDALQGRAGGSKKVHALDAIIPNDRQIYRVVIEKALAPWQARGLGHLTIRRLDQRRVSRASARRRR